MQCHKCNGEICPGEEIITCEGFCENSHRFHARCVGLSEDEGGACLHRNIFWLCDDCRDLMENVRFRNMVNGMRSSERLIQNDVEAMKSEIALLTDRMERVIHTVSNTGANSSLSEGNVRFPIGSSSSPLSSTKVNACNESTTGTGRTLELHLSNIANDVTEMEVKDMVNSSIGAENFVSIKCLVPSWKDARSLDWISFKVVVDAKCRDSVTKETVWPRGVRCREFKSNGKNHT